MVYSYIDRMVTNIINASKLTSRVFIDERMLECSLDPEGWKLIHSARALALEVERRGIMPRKELPPETFYERKESR